MWDFGVGSCFEVWFLVSFKFNNHFAEEERAGCITFILICDVAVCSVSYPCGTRILVCSL